MVKNSDLPNFEYGTVWEDPISGHRVGCLDASKKEDVEELMNNKETSLAIQDPPYNVDINDEFRNMPLGEYMKWSEKWVDNTIDVGTQKNWMAIRQELLYYIIT